MRLHPTTRSRRAALGRTPALAPVARVARVARGARGARGGFSMIELILVVAVIGVMAVIVSLSMDSLLPRERLNTAVRNVTALIETARSEAISRGLEYFVEYDLDEERYRMRTPFAKEGGQFRAEDMDESEQFVTPWKTLPPGVVFDSIGVTGNVYNDSIRYARFDPRGAASDHQIVLGQPAYENFYTIEVMALTGTFKFHKGIFTREAPDDGDFN